MFGIDKKFKVKTLSLPQERDSVKGKKQVAGIAMLSQENEVCQNRNTGRRECDVVVRNIDIAKVTNGGN